jgi:glycosyltransferase involved in cell wall biosynthesis
MATAFCLLWKQVKLSCAMIVRDADSAELQRAVDSIRPFVDEVVLVDTGSKEPFRPEGVDTFELFTGCNDSRPKWNPKKPRLNGRGPIVDFAAARNRSFELCKGEFIVWLDADDVVTPNAAAGPNILRDACQPGKRIVYPYQYNPGLRYFLPRIVPRGMRWYEPIHEYIDALVLTEEKRTDVTWVHKREHTAPSDERNIRICEYWKDAPQYEKNLRFWFYLAQSYANAAALPTVTSTTRVHYLKSAIATYEKLYALEGWTDQKFVICQRMTRLVLPDYQAFLKWAWRAVEVRPDWPNGYFLLGQAYYHLRSEEPSKWLEHSKMSIQFFELGMKLPKADSLHFVDVDEDRFEVHKFYNVVLCMVGRVEDALKSCESALKHGDDRMMRENVHFYRAVLAKAKLDAILSELRDQRGRGAIHADNIVNEALGALGASSRTGTSSRTAGPYRMAFVCAQAWERWNPDEMGAVKGSEIMLVSMARELAKLGAEVRVYSPSCGPEKSYAGVSYIPRLPSAGDPPCDTLIAFRHAELLESPLPSGRRVLWVHDICAFNGSKARFDLADYVFVNSTFHKSSVMDWHRADLHPSKVVVMGVGGDLARFRQTRTRDVKRCVWTSSPDRGLSELLDIWPRIVAAVPEASLHVYYGFGGWQRDPWTAALEGTLRKKMAEAPNVTFHGSVTRDEHTEALLTSGVWLYTSFWNGRRFGETGCVSAMEAQAAGLHTVSSGYGALAEVVFRHGRIVPGDPSDPGYAHNFFDLAVYALNDRTTDRAEVSRFAFEMFDNSNVVAKWKGFFGIEKVETPTVIAGGSPRMRVAVVCGECWEEWNPRTAEEKGIGGSEMAVIEVSKRLARLGHEVTVYGPCGPEDVYDGVRYVPEMRPSPDVDAIIAWRRADLLELGSAKRRVLWLHDACVPLGTPERLTRASAIVVQSDRHKDIVRNETGEAFERTMVIHPGLTPERFALDVPRNPKKAVWTSSPERGLSELLDMWPAILERVPEAELHVFYGFKTWETRAQAQGLTRDLERIVEIRAKIANAERVFMRGRVSRVEQAIELLSSGAWLYPAWHDDQRFYEMFCVSSVEAQAAGLRMVASSWLTPMDKHIATVDGDARSFEYQAAFVEYAYSALSTSKVASRDAQMKDARERYSWDAVTRQWERLLAG